MNAKKIALALIILLALPMLTQAAINCTAKTACSSGETEVLQISDGLNFTNSHGAIPNSGYSGKICCTEITSTTCEGSAKTMVRLSGNTNAHAEGPAETTAGYNAVNAVCIGSAPQVTSITLRNGSCNTGETCIVALSSVTNAHLAKCSDSAYPQKICASQAAGGSSGLVIEKIVVPNPAYKGQPLNVVVTIAKASGTTESGSISVQFVSLPGTTKTATFNIPAGQPKVDATVTYSIVELEPLEPGIYSLLIELFDNGGTKIASQTVTFALVNPASTASVPETNWIGAAIVLACVFTIVFALQRKKR